MQVAEVKTSSAARNQIQAKRQPFFSKEGQDSFFSKSADTTSSFFSPATIQPKLTIGEPNDKYEVEADAMADKVVQRLSSDTESPGEEKNTNTNTVQLKCTTCEKEEEEVQKKEDDFQKIEEKVPEVQEKPIFESNTEEAVQTKAEVSAPLEFTTTIDTSLADNSASNPIIQAKCETCEEEEMEEQGEEQKLQKKESTLSADDPTEEDPNVQLRSLEMEKTEYPILFKKIPNLQLSSRGGSGSGTREQIVEEAQKMTGKIEAKKDDGAGRRVGAEHLLEIFHLAADDAWSDEVIENVKYTDEFPHWCGIFSVYAIKKAGIDLGFWQVGMGVSSYGTLEPTDNPQPGDIGYFTKFQHHCIIKAVNGDTIDSIDGNSGNFSEIIERTRPRSDFHAFFTAFTGSEKRIQKKEDVSTSNNTGSSLQDSLNTSSGKGAPMDPETRGQMESGFGVDFGNVNIHTDSRAVQMNKDLNAQAFTHGNDIYFNEGKYDTTSTSGKHLLAHELTHTVQQGATPNVAPKIQKNGSGYEEQERRLNTLFSGIIDERLPLFNQAVDTQNQREVGLNGRRILFLWSEVAEIVRSIASQEVNASEDYQESRISELLPPVIKQSYDLTKLGILTRLSTQLYKGTSVLDRELIESEYDNTILQFISQQIARVSWVIKDLNAAIDLLNRQNLEEEHQWTFIGLIRQHQNPFDFGYMYKVLEDKHLLNRIASFAEAPSLAWEVINRSQIFIRESVTLDPGQQLGLFRLKPVESKLELLQPMTPKEISQRLYGRRQSWHEFLYPYNRTEIANNNGDTLLHAGTELRIIPALISDDQMKWIFMSVESALRNEEEDGTSPYLRQTTNHTPVVGNDVTFQLFWPSNGFPDHNIQWAFQNDPLTSPNASRIEGPSGFIHWEEENSNDTWELIAGYPGIHEIFATLTPRRGSGSRELSLEQIVLTTEEQTDIAFAQASGVNSQTPQEFLETLRERKRNATSNREREEIEARIQEIETSLLEDTRHPLSGQRTILRPLQAVFVSNEDQPLSVPLRIFIGSDPDWFAGDTRGYHMKIWDYTLQESTTWTGENDDKMQDAAKDAIQSFADYAPYPDGILRVRVPTYGRYDRQEIMTIETGGGRAIMDFIRALSMISLAVGVGSAFLGQPEIAIPAFALASALGGAAGTFNIATRLEHGNFEWDLETGMDILDVAGAVMTFGASSAATTTVRGVGRVTFMGRMSQAIDATQIVVMSGMHVAQIGAAVASGDRDRVVNALLSALADGALFLIIHRAGRRLQRGGTAVDDPRLHQLEGHMQDASSIIRADGTITIGGESHGMSLVMVDGQIVVRICSPNCSELARALGHAMELPEVRNDTTLRNRLETLELEASRLESRVNNVEENFTFEDAQPRVNEMLDELRAIGRDHPNLVDAIFNRSGMPEPEAHLSGQGSVFRAVEEGGAHTSESIRYVETPSGEIRAIDASSVPETLRSGQSFDIDGQTYKYLGDIEQRLLIDEGFSARDLARTDMRARIQESHDRGVELGRAEALREGVRLTHFDPPDQYLGLFGKGIDDLGRRGNVFYILEWKGGTSQLGSDQMSNAWVGRKLAELEIYNDPRAQQLLTAALQGRLKGRGYRTQRADNGSWETTRMDEGPLQGGEIVYDGQRVRSAYERRLTELRTRHGLDSSGTAVQPKLKVGQPNDKYEVEADAMADKVVQKLSNPLTNSSAPAVQAKCKECEEDETIQEKVDLELQPKPIFENGVEESETKLQTKREEFLQRECKDCEEEEGVQLKPEAENSGNTPSIETQLNGSKGSGRSLSPETQANMDEAFGADFSQVRIHTDSDAAEMNASLNAQAFTHGNDIYFNEGKYDTSGTSGKHLLAHELAHTIQQKNDIRLAPESEVTDSEAASEQVDNQQVIKPLKIFGYNAFYWIIDYKKGVTYGELRTSANFYDISNYLYGSVDHADMLASHNNLSVAQELQPGTRVIVGSKRLKGLRNTKLSLGHFNSSPKFPPGIMSPKQVLSNMGVADPKSYNALKKTNESLLSVDFNLIVMVLNGSYYSDSDEDFVIRILRKWAENKFVGNLGRYSKYKDGGYYLDKLFFKMRGKMKNIGGILSDEITSYYDLMFNHFDKINEVVALRNKYSVDFKKDSGIKEMSFFDDVVVDTVTGIPGGLAAGAGGLLGAFGWEGGEEWFKEREGIGMEMVGYCDNDPKCINQAIEGSAMVGGVVTEVGTMVYGGPIWKAVDMIQTVSSLGELKSIKTGIDILLNAESHLAAVTSWFSSPEKLLMLMLGLDGQDGGSINKIEAWTNSVTKEPELKGKETAFANERKKLKALISKIVKILKKVKEALKVIFNIRRKFIDFMQGVGGLIAGMPVFLKLIELIKNPSKNKKEINKLVRKLATQMGDKLQEFLLGGKEFLLSLIQNFQESILDLQLRTNDVANAITPFILAFVGKRIKTIKAIGAVPQIRNAISKYVIEPMIPQGVLTPINNAILKVVKGFQPAIRYAKNGVEFLHEHASSSIQKQIVPGIENLFIQRSSEGNTSLKTSLPDEYIEDMMSTSKGSSLPTDSREEMESEFQEDFSGVKIHTGEEASDVSEAIEANAFTSNEDIYFGKDRYQPNSRQGKHLLAHELTHVVHQTRSGQKNVVQRSYKKTLNSFVRKFGDKVLKSITGARSRSRKDRLEAAKILRKIRRHRLVGKRVDGSKIPDLKTITNGAYSFVYDKKSAQPKSIKRESKWTGLLPGLTIRRSKIQIGLFSQFTQKQKEGDENQAILKEKVDFQPVKYKREKMGKQVDKRFLAEKNIRPTKVHGHIDQMKNKVGRDAHFSASKLPGNEPGDHGGHLLGDRFYGPGTRKNLVPMTENLNLSVFPGQFETPMANWIKSKNKAKLPWIIYVTLSAKYDDGKVGRKRMRPIQINAWATGYTGSLDSIGRMKVKEDTISRNSFSN